MQRYKFIFPLGHEYACKLSTRDGYFMMPTDDGVYVHHQDAVQEFDRGLEEGRKEGQVKVDALKAIDQAAAHTAGYNKAIADLERARRDGAFDVKAKHQIDQRTIDQRTSQLLNELYHDRARLEKVIKVAVELAGETTASIATVLEQLFPGEDGPLHQATADLIMDAAKLRQFADDHGD